ncbi:MAG: HAD hydrolase family protein [Myxococcota bacterium]
MRADQSRPRAFVLDVDGVMTTGQFLYTRDGKEMKIFGPDDADALGLLAPFLEIRFVTADRRGFPITHRRIVQDMGCRLDLVPSLERTSWIAERYPLDQVIYMGDGIFDHAPLRAVGYGIATATSDANAQAAADYVTRRSGGQRAVAEACLHLLEKFFVPYDPARPGEPTPAAERERVA